MDDVDPADAQQPDDLARRRSRQSRGARARQGRRKPAEPFVAGEEARDEIVDGEARAPASTRPPKRAEKDGRASGGRAAARPARSAVAVSSTAKASGSGRRHRRRAEPGDVVGFDDVDLVERKGRRAAGRLLAHARRSPIRNSSARSSRIWGSDSVSPSAVRSSFGGRKRRKRSGRRCLRARSEERLRILRQVAGKHGDLALAVEAAAVDRLAGHRRADDRRRAARCPASRCPRAWRAPRRAPAPRPWRRRTAARSTARATSRARIASSRSWSSWWRWSALVAAKRMRSMRRETRPLSQPARPRRKAARMSASAASSSAIAAGPALSASSASTSTICRSRRAKWSRKNGPHHRALIGLVAPRHHGGEGTRGSTLAPVTSGEKVSAGEPSRSPGMRKRPGVRIEKPLPCTRAASR